MSRAKLLNYYRHQTLVPRPAAATARAVEALAVAATNSASSSSSNSTKRRRTEAAAGPEGSGNTPEIPVSIAFPALAKAIAAAAKTDWQKAFPSFGTEKPYTPTGSYKPPMTKARVLNGPSLKQRLIANHRLNMAKRKLKKRKH